jgi:hypothetical protein
MDLSHDLTPFENTLNTIIINFHSHLQIKKILIKVMAEKLLKKIINKFTGIIMIVFLIRL